MAALRGSPSPEHPVRDGTHGRVGSELTRISNPLGQQMAALPVTDRCAGRRSCSLLDQPGEAVEDQAVDEQPGFGEAAVTDPVNEYCADRQPRSSTTSAWPATCNCLPIGAD